MRTPHVGPEGRDRARPEGSERLLHNVTSAYERRASRAYERGETKMSAKVYKYTMPEPGETVIHNAPLGNFLHLAIQSASIQLWAVHDEDTFPSSSHIFVTIGTSQPIPEEYYHVGTVLDGPFVWHVFYTVEPAGEREDAS